MRNRLSLLVRVVLPSTAVVAGLVAVTTLTTTGGDSRPAAVIASAPVDDEPVLALSDAYEDAKLLRATAQRIATNQRLEEIAAERAAAAAAAAEEARRVAEAQAAAEAKAAAERKAAQRAERARLAAERAAKRAASKPPVMAAAAAPAPTDGYQKDVWERLRNCESGGRYDRNSGNGFYGAYQFHPRTWRGLGYPGLPHQAPPEMQDEAARRLQARSGWGQWPACSRRIGAR